MPITLAALGGLITGSFLNVVAYRLPRDESLLFPDSHCHVGDDAVGACADQRDVATIAVGASSVAPMP